jgi:hypothetical protein
VRNFRIVIQGRCPDDVEDRHLLEMASNAEVQVLEPRVELEITDERPLGDELQFDTQDVTTRVFVEGLKIG